MIEIDSKNKSDESPPDNVINLIFLGTEEHIETKHTLFTQFAKHLIPVHVLNGPGCKPSSDSSHPMPGTYWYNAETDEKIKLAVKEQISQLAGLVSGDGVQHNLIEAVMYITKIVENLKAQNNFYGKKTCLNVAGFSRGADTILPLANILYHLFPEIEFHGLALDPVPGPGRKYRAEAVNVSPNVKEYQCVLMEDESRPGFTEVQDANSLYVEDPTQTFVSFERLRGKHASAQKLSSDEKLQAPAYLMAYKAYEFFERNGATFKDNVPPPMARDDKDSDKEKNDNYIERCNTPKKRLLLFSEIRHNRKNFKKKYKILPFTRDFVGDKETYVRDAYYFSTQQEREDFKAAYPDIFDWYFQGGYDFYKKHPFPTASEIGIQFLKIYTALENLRLSKDPLDLQIYDNLQGLKEYYKKSNIPLSMCEGIWIPTQPTGYCIEERCRHTNHLPLVTTKLDYLMYKIETLIRQYRQMKGTELIQHDPKRIMGIALDRLQNFVTTILKSPAPEENKIAAIEKRLLEITLSFKKKNLQNPYVDKLKRLACTPETYIKKLKEIMDFHIPLLKKTNLLSKEDLDKFDTHQKVIGDLAKNPSDNTVTAVRQYIQAISKEVDDKQIKHLPLKERFTALNAELKLLVTAPDLQQPATDKIIQKLERHKKSIIFWEIWPWKNKAEKDYITFKCTLIDKAVTNLKKLKENAPDEIHDILKALIKDAYQIPSPSGKRALVTLCSKIIDAYGLNEPQKLRYKEEDNDKRDSLELKHLEPLRCS